MIPFNIPPLIGSEIESVKEAISNKKLCGDGPFTKKASQWLENQTTSNKVLLTTSGTHALEMAAKLCNLQPGDEVIMPSFTFSSTANSFVLMGARIAFVDIDPRTMNIDPIQIEKAINDKTKVIVPVHYAGVACDMDAIMAIAHKHNLLVVEDAAQAVNAFYKGKPLGSIGDFGCYSFHETKNYSMGEGGALLIRDSHNIEPAEILREKGTNRSKFFRGQVDKYSWVDYGSSYLPSELNVAFLYSQLMEFDRINKNRLNSWNNYYSGLLDLKESRKIDLPHIPEGCTHNAHMFYVKARNLEERTRLMAYLKENGVISSFHYVPLHSAPAGIKYGYFAGKDKYTTSESDKLLRLPMYYGLTREDQNTVIDLIHDFYSK